MDTHYAIGSLLEVLDSILHDAANYAAEALSAIRSGPSDREAVQNGLSRH